MYSPGQPCLRWHLRPCANSRVGQNHIFTVYIRNFWQGNHQIYGHIRCKYTVLATLANGCGEPCAELQEIAVFALNSVHLVGTNWSVGVGERKREIYRERGRESVFVC